MFKPLFHQKLRLGIRKMRKLHT